jgi:hypothetical protein
MGTVYHSQQYVEVLHKTVVSHTVSAAGTITVTVSADVACVYGLSAASTVSPDAAAVGWTYDTYEVAADATLVVTADASGSKAMSAGASAILTPAATASVQCVFDRSCDVAVQTITSELDTDTYEMVDVIEGLDCEASASRPISASAYQAIPLYASASKVVVHPDAVDVAATVTIDIDATADKNQYGTATAWAFVSAAASVDKCSVVEALLVPVAAAEVTLVTAQVATVALDIEVGVTYLVETTGIQFEYHPFVGAGAVDAPEPPPEALTDPLIVTDSFRLLYPATGTVVSSVLLRAPNLGNRDRLSFNRISEETRGGTLIVYADPIWPKVQTLVLSFSGLTATDKDALLLFMDTYLGCEIGLLDWEHRYWKGVITKPDAVVQDGRESFSASFEFEGELDPTWEP